MSGAEFQVRKIAGFGLTSPDAVRLFEFYQRAFDAQQLSSDYLAGAPFERLMSVSSGAQRYSLQLGDEQVDILQFDMPGRPYPRPASPYNPAFQHFAIVVGDMDLAMSQLRRAPGWTPLSSAGPQHLPRRSGGVNAFKFQDPDGHPLELLEFSADAVPQHWRERSNGALFLGIDHSAISVGNTAESRAYYQTLGFQVTGETYNCGTEQALLDGISSPHLEVTALSARQSTPHLELLCYQGNEPRKRRALASNDVAATRILLAVDRLDEEVRGNTVNRLIMDPDGHHLLVVS
ncbi:MAG: VOC family protein [Gammaproteobacteria bacterium]